MNLNDVLGIIVTDDGVGHSFGHKKDKLSRDLGDSSFHDSAFLSELYNSEWFKNSGISYNLNDNFFYNIPYLCAQGLVILINGCCETVDGSYKLYTTQVPEELNDNLRVYLSSIYNDLKKLIDEEESLFFGYTYDNEGNELCMIFNVDEFYDKIGVSKGNKKM